MESLIKKASELQLISNFAPQFSETLNYYGKE